MTKRTLTEAQKKALDDCLQNPELGPLLDQVQSEQDQLVQLGLMWQRAAWRTLLLAALLAVGWLLTVLLFCLPG